ncbi:uncharacterized protein H6S33_002194 [Morchella sextelata]|uniref:uncharacterized protein n=1 Tax=Morchella sextelata TaxID=1174677 RepID=UPI001D043BEE|nr:uncharacterized protein H6S33_002194 [Morchella sextelata]KAH0608142.1 hypothetical protein H6S33_002194 [Morchella sextelata]
MGDRGDRYTPSHSRDNDRDYDHDRRDRGGDRYPHDDRRPPSEMPRFTGREDSRANGHEFSFEHSRQLPTDSYRPDSNDQRSRAPPSGPRRGAGRSGSSRGRGGGNFARGGRDGKPFVFHAPVPAHERPILYFDTREKTPELMEGMAPGSGDRFKEDIEDGVNEGQVEGEYECEEKKDDTMDTPMEMSGNEGEAESGSAPKDKVGEEKVGKSEKKPDVISMIRAFKKQTATTRNEVAENDDFIPFSFIDEPAAPQQQQSESESEYEAEREREEGRKMRRANDGHRIVEHHGRSKDLSSGDLKSPSAGGFSHRDALYSRVDEKKPVQDFGPPGASTFMAAPAALSAPPGLGEPIKLNLEEGSKKVSTVEHLPKPAKSFNNKDGDMPWPPPPPSPLTSVPAPPPPPPTGVGIHMDIPKKRKFDEFNRKRNVNPATADGNVKPEWAIKPGSGVDPIPWVRGGADHSRSLETTDWLHKEITDFMAYIQPRAYEHAIRRDLVHRVRQVITNLWPDVDVRVFGSFAAELYLPTSDVDLVVVSKSFVEFDLPKYNTRQSLNKLAGALKKSGITTWQDVQVIASAKVPIIKFTDSITKIHVDISFENSSGLVANETFQRWKIEYPAMPVLVVLIKHFLSIRGLNEPYQGGLGSFSVTCMVISMLQLLPSVRSGAVDPRLHLGVMLLEFLELYGKNINTSVVGIRVDDNAPGYFRKTGVFNVNPNHKTWQLCIQDPHDPENDVAKSSYQISLILQCFADAYDALVKQMALLDSLPFEKRAGRSILGVIIGANYRNISSMRETLKHVYRQKYGSLDVEDIMETREAKGPVITAKEKREKNVGGISATKPKRLRGLEQPHEKRDSRKAKKEARVKERAMEKEKAAGGGLKDKEVIIID